ncbi:hypothetical protein ING2D1G_0561 [Peptoniphilus sp. ING2-D1G]|nr:hypothetical protein ING2D1G_0561 [Peptoniphilus sp. ING2-D1G]
MKKTLKKLMVFFVFVFIFSAGQKVEAKEVYAHLPGFDVTLNGIKVDNYSSEYPLLVYKDITYFPMTWYTTRFLGVETDWSESTGLVINQTGISGDFNFYNTRLKNANSYPVSIPYFRIRVNGTDIKNEREPYPLFVFRGVTYFPMTWRFCVTEFGWDYDFSHQKGLVISSKNEKKPITPQKPSDPYEAYYDLPGSIYYNGKYYMIRTNGKNYRLFSRTQIGNKYNEISSMQIKDFKQQGSKLYFASGDSYYSYDMDNEKLERIAKDVFIKDGNLISLGSEAFWVDSTDSTLRTKDNVKLNNGAKVDRMEKQGDYLIVTFVDNMDGKYKLMVFDKKGMEIYKTADATQNARIDGDTLTYFNVEIMRNETIKLN